MFGNLGVWEVMIILLIVLLLFGAKRIPEIAGSMGKGIREFKKNVNEATREVTSETMPRYGERLPPESGAAGERPVERDEEAAREPKRLI